MPSIVYISSRPTRHAAITSSLMHVILVNEFFLILSVLGTSAQRSNAVCRLYAMKLLQVVLMGISGSLQAHFAVNMGAIKQHVALL
jgi:hypothetical protein